jgi:hypothetical protein
MKSELPTDKDAKGIKLKMVWNRAPTELPDDPMFSFAPLKLKRDSPWMLDPGTCSYLVILTKSRRINTRARR